MDPNTGVTVLKLTSSSVPAANGGMSHGYSEGGPNISQPWTGTDGQTYYTAKLDGWLVDVRYGTLTTSNWRRQNSNGEIGFAFSLNPATPRIAYVVSGKRVDRYNTATNQVENTGGWPWVITAAGDYADWLQTHGDPLGELIAVQLELARFERWERPPKSLRDREENLLASFRQRWLPGVVGAEVTFVRGFVDSVKLELPSARIVPNSPARSRTPILIAPLTATATVRSTIKRSTPNCRL